MKRIVALLLLCALLLVMVGCGKKDGDYTAQIRKTRQELMAYFDTHKGALTALSEELLGILGEEKAQSINVDMENRQLVLFLDPEVYWSDDRRDFSEDLAALITAAEIQRSPIERISVGSAGANYLESSSCSFGFSVRNGENFIYNYELVYTQEPQAGVTEPSVVERLEDHWYLVSHYWY